MKTTKVGDTTVTLEDGRAIGEVVTRYLRTVKTADPVPPPGPPFIDCEGTMRLGLCILQSEDSQLRLSCRIAVTDHFRVFELIDLERNHGRWKAVRHGQIVYHMRPQD